MGSESSTVAPYSLGRIGAVELADTEELYECWLGEKMCDMFTSHVKAIIYIIMNFLFLERKMEIYELIYKRIMYVLI